MKNCKRCGKVKDWNGSDMQCPFQSGELFSPHNWNCGAIDPIRNLCDKAMNDEDHRLHYQYCDDQKYVTINIQDVSGTDGENIGLCLFVTWYKSRGGTDDMWILDSCNNPIRPTFEQLQLISNHYGVNK